MLHMGQYLLVWRYFTIQLLQTAGRKKQTLGPSGDGICALGGVSGWLVQAASSVAIGLVETRAWKNQPGSRALTRMKTLCDGGSIHEVASAQAADDVLIQVFDLYSDLLLRIHSPSPITPSNPNHTPFQLGRCLSTNPTAKSRTPRGPQGISSRERTLPLRPAGGSAPSGGSLHLDSPYLPFPGETTRRGRHNAQAS